MHQLNAALSELQSSRNTWFHKTLTSIREATKKDPVTALTTKFEPAMQSPSMGPGFSMSLGGTSKELIKE